MPTKRQVIHFLILILVFKYQLNFFMGFTDNCFWMKFKKKQFLKVK